MSPLGASQRSLGAVSFCPSQLSARMVSLPSLSRRTTARLSISQKISRPWGSTTMPLERDLRSTKSLLPPSAVQRCMFLLGMSEK